MVGFKGLGDISLAMGGFVPHDEMEGGCDREYGMETL
jgi:hypothetical protein